MKKFAILLMTIIMVLGITGCGTPEEEQPEEKIEYEIAMVTDSGMIMDGGYSQVAWTAISDFGARNGISHKYYKAAEASDAAYKAAIDSAVDKGAKVIVADGYSFENVVYDAQNEYKDVKFILIDAEPLDNESGEIKIGDNTAAVIFSSQQAGYLAGYSAVKEGKTQLGFIGDAKKPVIMDYGYGFLQGADAAAGENGIVAKANYYYCNSEDDRETVLKRSADWYETGIEIIFACGNHVEQPVIEAAEMADRDVIAFEAEKSGMSDKILTSTVKDIGKALETALEMYKNGEFPGGQIVNYDVGNEGIWLDLENSRFEVFEEDVYKDVIKGLSDGAFAVKSYDFGTIKELGLSNISVIEEQ